MAVDYKILGQVQPDAESLTDLYTVPGGTQTVCSTMIICNTSSTAAYRVAVRPAGATAAIRHYIVYDNPISNNDSIFLTLGLTLGPTDVVSVYAGATGVNFSLYGSEVS